MGDALVVTNGDQTDTIWPSSGDLPQGSDAPGTFEPDEPNWTPRISGHAECRRLLFELSILKRRRNPAAACGTSSAYEGCDESQGYFISTYQGDGNPLPTFAGEPSWRSTVAQAAEAGLGSSERGQQGVPAIPIVERRGAA